MGFPRCYSGKESPRREWRQRCTYQVRERRRGGLDVFNMVKAFINLSTCASSYVKGTKDCDTALPL